MPSPSPWKRIVVTVGEKIGKTHLTYAQGASAEVVAMLPKGYEFTDFEKIELNGKIRWTLK